MSSHEAIPSIRSMDSNLDPGSNWNMKLFMFSGFEDDSGVTAIEYGLLAALIVVACIGALSVVGTQLSTIYVDWSAAVQAAIQGVL